LIATTTVKVNLRIKSVDVMSDVFYRTSRELPFVNVTCICGSVHDVPRLYRAWVSIPVVLTS